VAEDAADRVADHVDELRVGDVLADALGDAGVPRQVRVVGRGLTPDSEPLVEPAPVPVHPEVPVQLLDEEVELLGLRHLDLGMEPEVVVDARRPALQAADDDQVREGGVLCAPPRNPAAALAIGGVAIAGARAHRLVGGIVRRLGRS
jgi:hypothetical protein